MKKFNRDIVIGATGAIGKEIAKFLISNKNSEEIILFSNEKVPNLVEKNKNIQLNLFDKDSEKIYLPYLSGINRLLIAHGQRNKNTLDSDNLTKMMTINYVATIKLIDDFLNHASSGSIVLVISSIASKIPSYEELGYASSKAALSVAIQAMQIKAINKGITLIDLKLGATMSSMNSDRSDYNKLIDPRELAEVINQITLLPFSTLRIPKMEIIRSQY